MCALTPLEESIQREPGAHLWWTRPSLSVSTVQRRDAWPAPEGMSNSNISGGIQACTLLLLRDLWYILPPYITIHHCRRVILHCRWLLCLPIHHSYSFIFHCTESWFMLRWTCQNTCFKADGPMPKIVQFHLQSELSCHSHCQEEGRLLCSLEESILILVVLLEKVQNHS